MIGGRTVVREWDVKASVRDSLITRLIDPDTGAKSTFIIGKTGGKRVIVSLFATPVEEKGKMALGMEVRIGTVAVGGSRYGAFMNVSRDTLNTLLKATEKAVKVAKLKQLDDGTFMLELAYGDEYGYQFEIWVRRPDGLWYALYHFLKGICEDTPPPAIYSTLLPSGTLRYEMICGQTVRIYGAFNEETLEHIYHLTGSPEESHETDVVVMKW